MFERFEERSRQVIVYAQDEARALRHNYIGTEHLLLGLLREREGIAAQLLVALGLTRDMVRDDVDRIIGPSQDVPGEQIPFTPRAKKVLELAFREALSLSDNSIGTEHLLLGLVQENDGVAARILLEHELDAEIVRDYVLRAIGAGERVRRQREAPPHESRPSQHRWEYRVETWPPAGGADRMEVLGRLGSEGWELVAAVGAAELIFKRPAPPPDPGTN